MKIIPNWRKGNYLARFGVILTAAGLIAGMVGCFYTSPFRNLEIRTWYDLDAIRGNLTRSYVLMNDLDSTTAGYEELAGPEGNEGETWMPIGTEGDPFTGAFDGQGYEIRDLFAGSGFSHLGVFGFVDEGGQIEHIGVVDAVVVGHEVVGGLVGVCYGNVTNSYFTGRVTGHDCAGGLVGVCYGTVTNSHSTGSVTSDASAGGLVGVSYGTVSHCYATGTVIGGFVCVGGLLGQNEGTVTNSYSTSNVTGSGLAIGGLVGANGWSANGYSGYGTVSNSYSTGSVTGEDDVGGLVGANFPGSTMSNSYATGNVDGEREVGGLVGGNVGTVTNSRSTGSVTGNESIGGLVGVNAVEGNVSNSYSTGGVTGTSRVGGLVGWNYEGTVGHSFWDIETSGQATSDGGMGKTGAEMKDITTFSGAGWNIIAVGLNETDPVYIWNIVDGLTYPFLSWQPVS